MFKKIKRFLEFHDWIWAVIMAFMAYWLVNLGPSVIGNTAMIYYAVNWVQPLISTFGIMSGLFVIARLGMWFNFKKLHRYIWGHTYKKESKFLIFSYEDFKNLSSWQKLLLGFLVFLFCFSSALIVFLKMMSLAGVGQPL